MWCCSHVRLFAHAIIVPVTQSLGANPWWLTAVYGPRDVHDKVAFLQELRQLRTGRAGPWLLCGDFGLIYKATDKSYGRLSRRLMGKMCRFL
jgi:hypothetical protein